MNENILPPIGTPVQVGFYRRWKPTDQTDSLFLVSFPVADYEDTKGGLMVLTPTGFHFPVTWIYDDKKGFLFS